MPESEGHSMTEDARGMKLGFGVLNFGFRNYAFYLVHFRQFASGGPVTNHWYTLLDSQFAAGNFDYLRKP
jgi:hypothetical protein